MLIDSSLFSGRQRGNPWQHVETYVFLDAPHASLFVATDGAHPSVKLREKNSIYNSQEKYIRCGAEFPDTLSPISILQVIYQKLFCIEITISHKSKSRTVTFL